MAILRKNSTELMTILEESQSKIESAQNEISIMNNNLAEELKVIRNIQEYTLRSLNELKEEISYRSDIGKNNKLLLTKENIIEGIYDMYGSNVHPKFLKTPVNIFNFGTAQGQFFKNNMNVSINGNTEESYKYMLMDDRIITKGITFEEFYSDQAVIRIQVNPDDLIGSTEFNTIEILPFMPGSFKIETIRVYTMEDYRGKSDVAKLIYNPEVENVGTCRIRLDKNYTMYAVELVVKMNFRNAAGRFPLGFKHIYFLKADYISDSYIIANLKRNDYIDTISEKIYVYNQNGKIVSTCESEDIKLYMTYESGFLTDEIATSSELKKSLIPKNIKNIYVKIPLSVSMSSIQFDFIQNRAI